MNVSLCKPSGVLAIAISIPSTRRHAAVGSSWRTWAVRVETWADSVHKLRARFPPAAAPSQARGLSLIIRLSDSFKNQPALPVHMPG